MSAQEPDRNETYSETQFYKAQVVSAEDLPPKDNFVGDEDKNDWQLVTVAVKIDNITKDLVFEHNSSVFGKNDIKLDKNNRIIISYQVVDGKEIVAFTDYDRTLVYVILLILFAGVLLLVGGWKGLRSLVGITWIIIVVIFYMIPQIISGSNVYWIVFVTSVLVIFGSTLIVVGISKKSILVVLSSFFGLIVSTLLVLLVGRWAGFSQFGLEESHMFKVSKTLSNLNLVDIIYGGMIVGALGSMMDITISIMAGVEELIDITRQKGARKLSEKEIFYSGLKIGREIMAVNANTLVLAYIGSSLIVWIIALSQNINWDIIIHFNMVFGEILRIIAGTLGIFSAIPLAAFLASKYIIFNRKLAYEKE